MERNRGRAGRRTAHTRNYYVDGSTVRLTSPSPYRSRQEGTRYAGRSTQARRAAAAAAGRQSVQRRASQPAQTASRRPEDDRKRQVNQRIAMRNREKALRLDLKYTLFLGVSVILVLASCVLYLNLQSQMTQKNNDIASLKSELNTLTDANVAARERINDAVDLDYVYEYATQTLGMVSPNPDQIITYRSNDEDYVKQFQDIPQSSR